MRSRFFTWLGGFLYDHAGKCVIVILGLAVLFGYFASTIDINLGLLNLLDQDDPFVKRVNYSNDNFGGMDYMWIGLIGDDQDRLIAFSNRYVPLLRAETKLVGRVVEKVDLDSMLPYGLLFLDSKGLDDFIKLSRDYRARIETVFSDGRLTPFVAHFNALLEAQILEENEIKDEKQANEQLTALSKFLSTLQVYLEKGRQMRPGRLKRDFRGLFIQTSETFAKAISEEYFFSDNGKLLVLRVMPSEPGDDFIFCRNLMQMLETKAAQVGKDFPDVKVIFAGNMAAMRDEHKAIVHDMTLSTILSLILVLIIFLVVFRKGTDLIFILLCLVGGLSFTYGLTNFAIGYLSLTTAFFGAMMIGLGIDYAIHVISHYGEHIKKGASSRESLIRGLVGIGPGVVTGALTTSAAFLVLLVARFKGVAQLGFVAGVGILVMLVLMLTLLPAMLALRDKHRKTGFPTIKSMGESIPLGKVADFITHHSRLGGLLTIILIIAAIVGALEVRFNYDYRSLEPRNSVAIKDIKTIQQYWGRSIDYGMLIADTVEESRALAKAATTLPSVKKVDSISDFIPTDQDAKIAKIRRIQPIYESMRVHVMPAAGDRLAPGDILALNEALAGSRKVIKSIKQLAILGGNFSVEDNAGKLLDQLDLLRLWLSNNANEPTAANATYLQELVAREIDYLLGAIQEASKGKPLGINELPAEVVENFRGKDGKLVVYAFPERDIWNELFMKKFNAELLSVSKKAISVGILIDKIITEIKQDFRFSVWLSLAAVAIVVFIDFKRLRTTLLALIPLLVASLWMVGIMPAIGMSFNLVNVAIVPLILGIGIDYGVHIIHRYKREPKDPIRNAVENTGIAILLSSLTTIAGFGTIGFATYIAIATLGQILALGVAFCLITAICVLPMILAWVHKKGWKL